MIRDLHKLSLSEGEICYIYKTPSPPLDGLQLFMLIYCGLGHCGAKWATKPWFFQSWPCLKFSELLLHYH